MTPQHLPEITGPFVGVADRSRLTVYHQYIPDGEKWNWETACNRNLASFFSLTKARSIGLRQCRDCQQALLNPAAIATRCLGYKLVAESPAPAHGAIKQQHRAHGQSRALVLAFVFAHPYCTIRQIADAVYPGRSYQNARDMITRLEEARLVRRAGPWKDRPLWVIDQRLATAVRAELSA